MSASVKKAWAALELAAGTYVRALEDNATDAGARERVELQRAAIAYAHALEPEHLAAAELGRKGGSVTSRTKAEAARANGARGGRPRKDAR